MSLKNRFNAVLGACTLIGALACTYCSSLEAYEIVASKSELDTPLMDALGYKQLRLKLDNGLEALLVSAPQAPRSCIGVAIGVGACNDPLSAMGLSHFCEHMVFLGSARFPDIEGTARFVAEHNGNQNAWTSLNRTVYGLSCEDSAWKEAVTRVADMLHAPLMKEEVLQCERIAIHEEFKKKLCVDEFIALSLLQSQTSPAHPLHKLLGGNSDTLKDVSSQELKEWVQTYYRAGNMSVYAISSLPIEEMAQTVEKAFLSMAAGELTHAPCPEIIEPAQMHKQLWADIPADRMLFLNWSLPALKKGEISSLFMQKALTHPYPGGLKDTLKQLGWISNCHIELEEVGTQSLFICQFALTEAGLQRIEDLKALFYDYVHFLQTTPWPKLWLNDYQNSLKVDWQMHVFDPDLLQTLQLADQLHTQPIEYFPDHSQWPNEESFKQAFDTLGLLQESTAVQIVLAPQAQWPSAIAQKAQASENWHLDPWIGTSFLKLEASPLAHLPEKIEWAIPTNNPLLPIETPTIHQSSADEFSSQKYEAENGSIQLFNNPTQGSTCDSLVWAYRPFVPAQSSIVSLDVQPLYWQMLANMLNEQLLVLRYEAAPAGQSVRLGAQASGLEIELSGYSSPSQEKLLGALFKELQNAAVDEALFKRVYQNMCDDYASLAHGGPINLFRPCLRAAFLEDGKTPEEALHLLRGISLASFQAWKKDLLALPVRHDLLIVSARPLESWSHLLDEWLRANPPSDSSMGLVAPSMPPFQKQWKEPLKTHTSYSHIRDGNLRAHLWPSAPLSTPEAIESFFCLQMLEPDFHQKAFSELRTHQQLGYVVQASVFPMGNKPALLLLVLSSSYDDASLSEAMQTFTQNFLASMKTMSDDEFLAIKNRLFFQLQEPSSDSSTQLGKLHDSAWVLGLDPSHRKERLELLRAITKEHYLQVIQELLSSPFKSLSLLPKEKPGVKTP